MWLGFCPGSVEPDHTGNVDKSLAMMAGSKHTEIQTLNSVVSIEVTERPRQPDQVFEFSPSYHVAVDTAKVRLIRSKSSLVAHDLIVCQSLHVCSGRSLRRWSTSWRTRTCCRTSACS